ncbi:hypothetical protein GCM10017688_44300 [Streptomyces ramulosus]
MPGPTVTAWNRGEARARSVVRGPTPRPTAGSVLARNVDHERELRQLFLGDLLDFFGHDASLLCRPVRRGATGFRNDPANVRAGTR